MTLLIDRLASPIGTIVIVSDGRGICTLDYADYEERMMRLLRQRYGEARFREQDDPHGASRCLRAYFDGRLDALAEIPVETGGTPFQKQVWTALREIPVGTTTSYGKLAERLGRPAASRAVGLANSLNPVAIIVPCHRVIGANSALTGYAGGLERKRWLLEHEGFLPQGLSRLQAAQANLFNA